MKNKRLVLAEKFRPLLTDLYWAANNPNKVGAAPGQVMVTKQDGWEFGCKVEELGMDLFRRKVFVRPEQPFVTIPKKQKDSVMGIVFDTMFDKSVPCDEIEVIAPNCVMISQMFAPVLMQKVETAKTHIKIDDKPLDETGKVVH